LTWILQPIYANHVAGNYRCVYHAWLVCWDGILLAFCLGWPRTSMFLISTSQVTGITGGTTVPGLESQNCSTGEESDP
jgi:hypothetical protein